jgi:3-oxoacyl-[acyl-carrier protein] reductase
MSQSLFSRYDDIKIGDIATLEKKITEDEVRKFVALTGDDNPLHVDKSYAEKTSFKGIVVHGMLGASFVSTLIGTKLPGEGALWVSQNFDFLLPVRLGDVLTVECEVVKKHDKEQLIELKTVIKNQNRAVVVSGVGKVKILEIAKTESKIENQRNARVAIVTGATGGIGQAICLALSQNKYKVVVSYRTDDDKAHQLAEKIVKNGGQALLVKSDLGDVGAIERLVKEAVLEFATVSVLVNNASPRINPCRFLESEWSNYQQQLNIQVKAAFELMKWVSPLMAEQKYGSIINISSQVIDGSPTANWSAYALAKEALKSLTKAAALELGPLGIRVNQVAPGMVDTPLIGDIPEKARLMIARQTPLRKLATPEDVAKAVAFLASDDSSHFTGETLRLNGGMVMV